VNGQQITIPTDGGKGYAIIDISTTSIAGPPSVIANIFAQVPNSVKGNGSLEGYYLYPCDTTVAVSISFGGPSWFVSPADFRLQRISDSQCISAFYEIDLQDIGWIIGDTFLKNVYTVLRYDPASVGFAQLSSTALAMNDAGGVPPSPTIGQPSSTVTADSNGVQAKFGERPLASFITGLVALAGVMAF